MRNDRTKNNSHAAIKPMPIETIDVTPGDIAIVKPGKLYPPLPTWKMALLLLLTFNIYTVVWYFRAARDVKAARNESYRPWLWALAPMAGVFSAFAGAKLSEELRQWADDSGADHVSVNQPTLIVVLIVVMNLLAALPDGLGLAPWSWITALFGLPIPFLFMQAQLNEVKHTLEPSAFSSAPMKYTGLQVGTVIVFGLIFAMAMGIIAYDAVSRGPTEKMAVGDILDDAEHRFRLEINVAGWKRIEPGYSSEDGELEFVSTHPDDWAVVFYLDDINLDSHIEDRAQWIQESFPSASCKEHRTLLPDTLHVITTLDCSGRDTLYGHFRYRSHVVADEDNGVELLMFLADEKELLLKSRQVLLDLAEGLTLQ